MNENYKNTPTEEWLKEIPVQSENPAFKPEEMIACAKCARKSAPTRLKCFYCGAELEISEAQTEFLRPSLRKMETWEKGFNLIFKPNFQNLKEENTAEIAKMLKIENETLKKLVSLRKALPLARAESEKEAEILKTNLQKFDFETLIVSDESLAAENHPKRLRGIEFWDDKIVFVLFNQDEIVEISSEDLVLIVTGAVYERRMEATEKRDKKSEDKQILQTTETASDEFLIDVYSRQDKHGYRIYAKGFDFSSLEAEKGILASENMQKLVKKIREVAPGAKFVDDYLKVREILGNVWEVEHKTDAQGVSRKGFGSFSLANVTIANNLQQFTKYSRLQRQML